MRDDADFMQWLADRDMWVVRMHGGAEGDELQPVGSGEAREIVREWRAEQDDR